MRRLMAHLDRRTFLVLAAVFAPVARLRVIAQRAQASTAGPATISVDDFVRLSQRLVGRTTLNAQVAATYLNALVAVPANIPLLAQIANATSPRSPARPKAQRGETLALQDGPALALERTIIEWWYTGAYTLNGEPRLATHTGALMWSALGMPAPGTCASGFGAWSRPPRTAA